MLVKTLFRTFRQGFVVVATMVALGAGCGLEIEQEDHEEDRSLRQNDVCSNDDMRPDCNLRGSGIGCNDAIVLPLGDRSIKGSTVGGQDNGTGSGTGCSTLQKDVPDQVYTFTLTERTLFNVDMIGASGFDTALHLRTQCTNAGTQITCNDDRNGSSNAGFKMVLDPGAYFLFADGYKSTGTYTLNYTMTPDPCVDNPCGNALCVPSESFDNYSCQCKDGMIALQGECVADPCQPNPCTVANQNVCVPRAPGQALCQCNPGYVANNSGGCKEDPNQAEWTFMVFLNADNNLESDGLNDLAEMQKAGSNDKVNIIVLMDTYRYNGGKARKLYVTKGGYKVLEEMGDIDMGNAKTLSDFGVWTAKNYPAKKYALILWNHGDGWTKDDEEVLKGISYDDTSRNHISIAKGDYARGLEPITQAIGRPLDLIGFDACLMAMWEVAEASAPYAKLMVSSEETEPAAGWSYDKFLPQLIATPTQTPLTLAKNIADSYYNNSSQNVTMSVMDLTTLTTFDRVLNTFADELQKALSAHLSKIGTARNNTRKFDTAAYRDLSDFARNVAAQSVPDSLKKAANEVIKEVGKTVVHNKVRSNYSAAKGMSIYIKPSGSLPTDYYRGAGAIWSKNAPRWIDFLNNFY